MRAASIVLAMMILFLAGCGSQQAPPDIGAVWEDGEISELVI